MKNRRAIAPDSFCRKEFGINFETISIKHAFINYNIAYPPWENRWYFGSIDLRKIGLGNLVLHSEMMSTISPGIWLDGDLVDLLIGLYIMKSGRNDVQAISCYNIQRIFRPKLFVDLMKDETNTMFTNPQQIWMSAMNVTIGVSPCCEGYKGNHWVLIIVDFLQKKFFYIDPKESSSKYASEMMKVFLTNIKALMATRGIRFDEFGWEDDSKCLKHELQKDRFNCGIFTIKYARCYLEGSKLSGFTNMSYERIRMKYEALTSLQETCFHCPSRSDGKLACSVCSRSCCNECSNGNKYHYIPETGICEICSVLLTSEIL